MTPSRVLNVVLAVHLLCGFKSWTGQPSFQPKTGHEGSPNAIIVDVLEAGRPEHYWQFEVRPSTGQVRMILRQEFKDYRSRHIPSTFQQPAGAANRCEDLSTSGLASPDGKYIARCTGRFAKLKELTVVDAKTSSIVFRWIPKEWRDIEGLAWSPNSQSIAVLNHAEHYGKSPLAMLEGLSGHPIPHNTEYIEIIDLNSIKLAEYLIRKNVFNSSSRILSWSK
jgi:hypothetical protein